MMYLSLANNNFQGNLAQLNWTTTSQLRFLNLSGNLVAGSLPDTWSQLRGAISVDVSRNRLSGSLPATWGTVGADGQTMALTLLDASSNNLTGKYSSLVLAIAVHAGYQPRLGSACGQSGTHSTGLLLQCKEG